MFSNMNDILERSQNFYISYQTLNEYMQNSTTVSFTQIDSEETIRASIIFRGILHFINTGILFKEESRNVLYKKLSKYILYYLLNYMTNN